MLEYAKGEYIKFLCADDKIHPQLLEKLVAVMGTYPSVSIVSSYLEEFGDYTLSKKYKHTGGNLAITSLPISTPEWSAVNFCAPTLLSTTGPTG
jgi:glycosyltransferase involved in cell wall biosynthesis